MGLRFTSSFIKASSIKFNYTLWISKYSDIRLRSEKINFNYELDLYYVIKFGKKLHTLLLLISFSSI